MVSDRCCDDTLYVVFVDRNVNSKHTVFNKRTYTWLARNTRRFLVNKVSILFILVTLSLFLLPLVLS